MIEIIDVKDLNDMKKNNKKHSKVYYKLKNENKQLKKQLDNCHNMLQQLANENCSLKNAHLYEVFDESIDDIFFDEKRKRVTVKACTGRVAVVTCEDGVEYNKELGMALAISKFFLGNKTFRQIFDDYIYSDDNDNGNGSGNDDNSDCYAIPEKEIPCLECKGKEITEKKETDKIEEVRVEKSDEELETITTTDDEPKKKRRSKDKELCL